MFRTLRFLAVLTAAMAALESLSGPVARSAGASDAGQEQTSPARGNEPAMMIDLSDAVVVAPSGLSRQEQKAVSVLVEEVESRSGRRWGVRENWPAAGAPIVAVGRSGALPDQAVKLLGEAPARQPKAEGYRIRTEAEARAVVVAGNDARGVLFGVGRLLRELRMTPGKVLAPAAWSLDTAPRYPIRGHQLGYRPKTNSYDGWDLPQWDRYIRELAIFGANSVELIPPRSDDAPNSPHFPRPPAEMMEGMSRICDEYGLDVWLWNAALEHDYTDPAVVSREVAAWDDLFRRTPRLDAVFVPGGDPGHTAPAVLMALLEKQAEVLRRYHPNAQMWVSTQGFDKTWLEQFYAIVAKEPEWLTGVVYGPHTRDDLHATRAGVPKRYPIRHYPDITHTRECQFPVPDWDLAFASTEGREPINPRPRQYTTIFRAMQNETAGFIAYSEGCNDDVNKFIWNALGWDEATTPIDTLWQFSRFLLGERCTDSFAQGVLALERNWEGPLLTNGNVETTLQQFQAMERAASPRELLNWRFQQALYRAYYDAYLKRRLAFETELEARAMDELRRAGSIGSIAAIERARGVLARASTERVAGDLRARIFELAEALFQSIHMQLSVVRYQAIGLERGANLDAINAPLNNRNWLETQFAAVRALAAEPERLRAVDAIVRRTDTGPGGFYDDLGNPSRQPHLVPGPGLAADPMLRLTRVGLGSRPDWPLAWCQNAESLYDAPLRMRYTDLDPTARYRLKVVYSGGSLAPKVSLEAEGVVIHPLLAKPDPVRPLEFDIPRAATADGVLNLTWTEEPGRGANGRGCQVGEVWLIRAGD
jgi:hypothetical protein